MGGAETTVKPALSSHLKEDQKLVSKTDYNLMQIKIIATLSTCIKLPSVFKSFKTCFIVLIGQLLA